MAATDTILPGVDLPCSASFSSLSWDHSSSATESRGSSGSTRPALKTVERVRALRLPVKESDNGCCADRTTIKAPTDSSA